MCESGILDVSIEYMFECSMRWDRQKSGVDDGALPGLARLGLVRSVRTPQFDGITFHEILCKKQVPTVLVVTGLEHEENLDEWWWKNREAFEHQGIRPDDTVCITATRGKLIRHGRRVFDDDYEQSLAKIQNLILNRTLLRPPFVNKSKWFYEVTRKFFFFFQWTTIRKAKDIQKIADACGMSNEETARLKQELVKI